MIEISIVIPVYKCANSLEPLFKQIQDTCSNLNFELILVYDGGPLDDWIKIKDLSTKNKNIIGIELSKNFGQYKAITAGLSYARGEWIIVMDGDLQDNPNDIQFLYRTANSENVDIVFASRKFRDDTFFKKNFSKLFYKVLEYLTETKQDCTIGNFGIYHNHVIKEILKMQDAIRYFPSMARWVGFKSLTIDVTHEMRKYDRTSYSYRKLINLALDVMLAFSDKLLRIIIKIGLLISFITFLFSIFIMIKYFSGNISQIGYTSIIISIWFLAGLTIAIIGIIGLYVGKTFDQTKNRPLFIVRSILNRNN